ncbi:hypothetical protein HK097_001654 [Rhizophlyctis rosea]|uniref:DUF1749-domain-containing protein n=1 Tax=Rhizophlyctis rosea TaxID=64517 RepID=A0AAD5S6F5_9FUNG|nr:hypothetical protein HK097_001654 [Rhizophlyctis rosea]
MQDSSSAESTRDASLTGDLYIYNPSTHHTAFESNPSHPNVLIFLSGQTEGPLHPPYLFTLSSTLAKHSYSLVQPILSSSYLGFGYSSLDDDVKEIGILVEYLKRERGKSGKIVLMGHSTGAQITLHFLRTSPLSSQVSAGILQAPVSDREYMVWKGPESVNKWLPIAEKFITEGKGDEFLPREAYSTPITSARYASLTSTNLTLTLDDYFSSDLPTDHIKALFSPAQPLLILLSGSDEYVPPHVDPTKLLQKWMSIRAEMRRVTFGVVINGADHTCSGREEGEVICGWVEECLEFVG